MFKLFIIYNILFLFRQIESFSLINLNTTQQNFTIDDSNFTIINITNIDNIDKDYYLKFEFKSNSNNLFDILFFDGNDYNNSETRYLNQKNPLIYHNLNISKENKFIYVKCLSEFTVFYGLVKNPYLKDNTNFTLFFKEDTTINTIYYKTEITNLNSNNILINVMGKSIENFPISFYYGDDEIKSEKNFINGKGLLITNKSGIILDELKFFTIKFIPIKNDSITISSRIINTQRIIPTTKIDLLSETNVVLTDDLSIECFSVKSDSNDLIYLNGFSKQGIMIHHVESKDYNNIIDDKKILNSDYFLFNLNLSKVFCFTFENDLPQNTINFQIFPQDKISDINHILMPVLRGVEYKFFLNNSNFIYHRLASFNKNIKYTSNSDFYIKIKLLKGKIEFYNRNCSNFPNCSFNIYSKTNLNSNAIEENNNFGDVSFNYNLNNYSNIYFSKYQILPTVKCNNENNNEGCEYTFQIINEVNDLRYVPFIYKKYIYKNYDFIGLNSKNICYTFNIEEENINSIKIELNLFSGNSDLKSFSDSDLNNQIGDYYSLDNKEYVIINKNETQKNLIDQYYYCINNISSAFSVSKIILNSDDNFNDYITEGEIEINSINFKEKTKKFIILKQKNSSYFIFVKASNCKLNISYNNNNEKISNHAQFLDYNTSNESELNIILDSFDSERTNQNENCIFYTGISNIENPINIKEGISYDLTLSKNLKKMMFKYDFYLNKTKLLLFIDKYNAGILKITIHSSNSKVFFLTDFNNFKLIEINLSEITLGNNLNHSVIFIDIEYYEEIETDINYSLKILYSENKYYLPSGELILDKIESSETHYFYTDIKKDKYAEIVLNLKTHSSTNFYGKIIKNENSNNNFVELPTKNYLTYDYYNRKFIINKEDTKECDDNIGCKLIIGIKNNHSNELNLYYSIFLRYDETIVKIKNEEYLFGTLEINDKEKQYDYYSYSITKNIYKFHIIFDTELCEIYINEGEKKPSNNSFNYKIGSDVNSFEISSENSLINKVYTIAVAPKDLNFNYKSFYRFKIVEQPNEKIIYFIESQNEEFCEIENDDGNCFYILKYNSNNKIYNFYAKNLLYIEPNNINIKAKIVNMKEFELSNNKLSYFNNDDFEYKNILNGYLTFSINLNYYKEEQIILIKLTSQNKGKISLTSQFFPNGNIEYLNPIYYKIFTIENNLENIKFEGNDSYYFRFQILSNSSFNLSQTNTNFTVELNQEEQNNIVLVDKIIENSNNSNVFKLSSENEYFTLIGKYTQRNFYINFDVIEYGNYNYFNYYSSYNNIFPIIFYLPVVQSKKNIIIYVNITNNISSFNDFNVYGILTDSVSIMKAKRNLEIDFKIAYSECKFDIDENFAVFKFNAKDINNFNIDDKKYFYIKLNSNNAYNLQNISLVVDIKLEEEENLITNSKSSSNSYINSNSNIENNSESDIKSSNNNDINKSFSSSSSESENEYSSSSKEDDSIFINEPVIIKTKSYYTSIIKKNEINSFLLNFFEKNTSKMKLEISFPTNKYSISFRAYKNSSTKSPLINDKNIKNIDSNGKIIYIISELSNYFGIVVQISPKNNKNYRKIEENNSDFFTVKYKEYSKYEEIIYDQYYFNNNSINFSSNDNYYVWSVEQLNSINENNNHSIKYLLNLFNSNDYSSISILESISYGNSIYSFNNYTLNDSSKTVEFIVNKNDISNKISYYINIIANITYNNNDYELLCAKPISFLINSNNEEENISFDDNKKKDKFFIIFIIILFFIIIVVIIFIFFCITKNKYENNNLEKIGNERNGNNLNTDQNYLNIDEKAGFKNIEMKNIEHPVNIK